MCRLQLELFYIMDWLNKNFWLQWFVSGFLLGIGFIFPTLWMVGIVGGAYFLYLVQQKQSNKSLYLGAWLSWTVKTAAASVWFWSIYPIEWLPSQIGKIQLLLIGGYWLVSSISLGVGGILVALAIKYGFLYIKSTPVMWGFIIPSAWVLAEVLGSLVFSIVLIGPGGTINTSLSFGYSGYLLAENEWLLQFANIAGVYSLSFLFAVFALFLLHLERHTIKEYRLVLIITLVLFLGVHFFIKSEKSPDVENTSTNEYSVVTIDTSFPVDALRNRSETILISEELKNAMAIALKEKPDYIILPEDARFFNQQNPTSIERSLFQFQYDNPDTVIIDSSRAYVGEDTVLQTFIYNGSNNEVEKIQKRYLVPQGEFISSLLVEVFRIFGLSDVIDRDKLGINYKVGPDIDQSKVADRVPGILFCFESVAPQGVRTLMKERPNLPFVAHQISHAWFHEPYIFWYELDTMLKVQAVWNQKYIISAGSHVEGKVVTPSGKIESLDVIAEGEMWKVKKTTINLK